MKTMNIATNIESIDDHFAAANNAVISESPEVLTEIYQEPVNIAVWQNSQSQIIETSAQTLITESPNFKLVLTVTPESALESLLDSSVYLEDHKALCEHVALLVDMFCTLFELKRVGLRLTALSHAMCPKFHVDKVPCRLVTTFVGDTTQWLPSNVVDRTKLGAGSLGLPDHESGVYQKESDIQQLLVGDVALLKGEGWFNNEGNGIVHRSPALLKTKQRLLLTLDFID